MLFHFDFFFFSMFMFENEEYITHVIQQHAHLFINKEVKEEINDLVNLMGGSTLQQRSSSERAVIDLTGRISFIFR